MQVEKLSGITTDELVDVMCEDCDEETIDKAFEGLGLSQALLRRQNAAVKRLFEVSDTDGDGALDKEELRGLLEGTAMFSPEVLDSLLEEIEERIGTSLTFPLTIPAVLTPRIPWPWHLPFAFPLPMPKPRPLRTVLTHVCITRADTTDLLRLFRQRRSSNDKMDKGFSAYMRAADSFPNISEVKKEEFESELLGGYEERTLAGGLEEWEAMCEEYYGSEDKFTDEGFEGYSALVAGTGREKEKYVSKMEAVNEWARVWDIAEGGENGSLFGEEGVSATDIEQGDCDFGTCCTLGEIEGASERGRERGEGGIQGGEGGIEGGIKGGEGGIEGGIEGGEGASERASERLHSA